MPSSFWLKCVSILTKATLRHHVSKYIKEDPEFGQKVLDSFYVDDFVSGESDTEKTCDLFDKAKSRMGQGGFKLRKWVTNSKELKRKIDLHEEGKGNEKNVVSDHESNCLGL